MKKTPAITCLFLDIGGVLLSDGWNYAARKAAANRFHLDLTEPETRGKEPQSPRSLPAN